MASRGLTFRAAGAALAAAVVAVSWPPAAPAVAATFLIGRSGAIRLGLVLAVATLALGPAPLFVAGPLLLLAAELAFDAADRPPGHVERAAAAARGGELASVLLGALAVSAACTATTGVLARSAGLVAAGAVSAGLLAVLLSRLAR